MNVEVWTWYVDLYEWIGEILLFLSKDNKKAVELLMISNNYERQRVFL